MGCKLSVEGLYKVFGDDPAPAMELLRRGKSKEEIFAETGLSVGVRDVSLEIMEGEIFVVMGLSGSGKSTLVRLLNRLIEPTAGKVVLDGVNIASLDAKGLRQIRRKKMGMVFQSFSLMPHMSVLDNVAFGLELDGIGPDERRRRAHQVLDRVGLASHHESMPDALSGGMQQRVGLARALCADPDILLMDEAFSALDPLIRSEMQDELLRIQQTDQRTVVFISHDLDEAARIGDRIAIMEGGKLVQVGTPEEILNDPANEYVRSFFRNLDVGHVYTAGDICHPAEVELSLGDGDVSPDTVLKRMDGEGARCAHLTDGDERFVGHVSRASLERASRDKTSLEHAFLADPAPLPEGTPVRDLLGVVARAPCAVPVITDKNKYLGVIAKGALLETLDRAENILPEGEGSDGK